MSVGFRGTVRELRQKQAAVGSEQMVVGTGSVWRPGGFLFRFHKHFHEKVNLIFGEIKRKKKVIEAQGEDTFSVFPLIFSAPQISGDLSRDPVQRQPER